MQPRAQGGLVVRRLQGHALHGVHQVQQMPTSHPRGYMANGRRGLPCQDQRTHAVAAAHQHLCHHAHKRQHQAALALPLGAKSHGASHVQQKPGADLAVFLVLPHMGYLKACRDIPVDVAHIVMRLVFAQIGEVQARTAKQAAVIALQRAVEAAQHGPVKLPQQSIHVGPRRRGARHSRSRIGLPLTLKLTQPSEHEIPRACQAPARLA